MLLQVLLVLLASCGRVLLLFVVTRLLQCDRVVRRSGHLTGVGVDLENRIFEAVHKSIEQIAQRIGRLIHVGNERVQLRQLRLDIHNLGIDAFHDQTTRAGCASSRSWRRRLVRWRGSTRAHAFVDVLAVDVLAVAVLAVVAVAVVGAFVVATLAIARKSGGLGCAYLRRVGRTGTLLLLRVAVEGVCKVGYEREVEQKTHKGNGSPRRRNRLGVRGRLREVRFGGGGVDDGDEEGERTDTRKTTVTQRSREGWLGRNDWIAKRDERCHCVCFWRAPHG
mmetsp:Transcript_2250/g.7130  ORF Transcript_2250/g.7130 Transcript_2250/m.7130 type:complete len:279 (-) Transcript_2250:400-1236(-)